MHTNAEPPLGRRFELLAHILDSLDRRIPFRVHIRCFQNHFLICRSATVGEHAQRQWCGKELQCVAPADHVTLPCWRVQRRDIYQVIIQLVSF